MSLLNQSGGDYYVCNDYGIIFDKYCNFTAYKRGIWFPSSNYTESTPPSQRTYDRFFISDGIPYITSEVTLENGDNIHNNICCDLNYSTFFKNQSNGISTVASKSYWNNEYGLYTNNSDIAGVRNIFFYAISSSTTDGGLLFKKSSGWDKFWVRDGVGYIGINYTNSNNPTGTYTLLSTGNYTTYVVPKTGGTYTGNVYFSNCDLILRNSSSANTISLDASAGKITTTGWAVFGSGIGINGTNIINSNRVVYNIQSISMNAGIYNLSTSAGGIINARYTGTGETNHPILYNYQNGAVSVNACSGNLILGASDASQILCNKRLGINGSGQYIFFNNQEYPHIRGNGSSNFTLTIGIDTLNQLCISGGVLRPGGNAQQNLGNSAHRWATIYAASGSINTSDRNQKNTINTLNDKTTKDFIMGLKPMSYKLNYGTSGRTHWGMIAQDVEELLEEIGISSTDFAGFIKSPKTREYMEEKEVEEDDGTGTLVKTIKKIPHEDVIPNEYEYGLRYDEFISPIIRFIQLQEERIEALEQQLANKN
jgi:hypothetical protein